MSALDPATSIFISYAHADARPRPHFTSSRMTALLDGLRYELKTHDSRSEFKVIRDKEGALITSDRIDPRLAEHIAQADIALVFLSESYCRSEECEKELKQFIAQDKKLVLVELDEVWATGEDHLLVPLREQLEDLLSIRFWERTNGELILYGYPLPQTAKDRSWEGYYEVLPRLAQDIRQIAKTLRETAARPAPTPHLADDPTKVSIVLAASTSATKVETDRLERVYEAAGYGTIRLDRFPAPLTAAAIKDALAQGDLFVQLIGPIPGREIEDFDNQPSTIAQHKLAAEAEIDVATWMPNDFDASECGAAYAAFLADVTIHRASFEDFEKYSLDLAERSRKALESDLRKEAKRSRTPGRDLPLVSIDASKSDRALRHKITDALEKHVDVDHIDESTSLEALSDAVRDNDAILLVYGQETEGQKRAKAHFRFFRRWRRTVWNEDQQRFEIAFGDAAPDASMPCPSGPDIHIIRIDDHIDPVSMKHFLEVLGVEPNEPLQ